MIESSLGIHFLSESAFLNAHSRKEHNKRLVFLVSYSFPVKIFPKYVPNRSLKC